MRNCTPKRSFARSLKNVPPIFCLKPDVCNCGGILELKEIVAMAEPYLVAILPHNYNSTTVGLAATIQACAVMPNFLITEYFVNFTECGDMISINPLAVEKGYIQLPTAS